MSFKQSKIAPVARSLYRLSSTGEGTPLSKAVNLLSSDLSTYILTCNEFFKWNAKLQIVRQRRVAAAVAGIVSSQHDIPTSSERLFMSNVDSVTFNTASYALKELTETLTEMAQSMRRLQYCINQDSEAP